MPRFPYYYMYREGRILYSIDNILDFSGRYFTNLTVIDGPEDAGLSSPLPYLYYSSMKTYVLCFTTFIPMKLHIPIHLSTRTTRKQRNNDGHISTNNFTWHQKCDNNKLTLKYCENLQTKIRYYLVNIKLLRVKIAFNMRFKINWKPYPQEK